MLYNIKKQKNIYKNNFNFLKKIKTIILYIYYKKINYWKEKKIS